MAEVDASPLNPPSPSKRKRTLLDESIDRPAKRDGSANLGSPDPSSGPFNLETMPTPHSSTRPTAGVNVSDFDSLQQATADHSEVTNPANASSTAAAALGSMFPNTHLPQTSPGAFANPSNGAAAGYAQENSYSPKAAAQDAITTGVTTIGNGTRTLNGVTLTDASLGFNNIIPKPLNSPPDLSSNHPPKPAVGTEEWHKQRKHSHKEVERRRRETINEGINELAKIVPSAEKNKGHILQAAVTYIASLTAEKAAQYDKWNIEKLVTEQAIQELSVANEKLRKDAEETTRQIAELEKWKAVAQGAGLSLPPNSATS